MMCQFSLMSATYNQADLNLLVDGLSASMTLNCDLTAVNVVEQEVFHLTFCRCSYRILLAPDGLLVNLTEDVSNHAFTRFY